MDLLRLKRTWFILFAIFAIFIYPLFEGQDPCEAKYGDGWVEIEGNYFNGNVSYCTDGGYEADHPKYD